jgi:hypothetical protein
MICGMLPLVGLFLFRVTVSCPVALQSAGHSFLWMSLSLSLDRLAGPARPMHPI